MENIDWQHLLFAFDGRINRAKFWTGIVVMWAVMWILAILAGLVDSWFMWTVFSIVALLIIWPSLAISIKRWHDRDKSGWWVLIGFIPLVGPIWALVETGFLPGTPGTNEYGPDPLA